MSEYSGATTLLADSDGWHGHMDWGGPWLMLVWGILTLAPLLALTVWVVRTTGDPPRRPGPLDDDEGTAAARRILAERYARGEISTDEYRERGTELG